MEGLADVAGAGESTFEGVGQEISGCITARGEIWIIDGRLFGGILNQL